MKIEKLADKFRKEYGEAFEKAGNPMATGYGRDSKTGKDTIEVRLWYDKLKETLPTEYHGTKVNVRVTGVIKAL